MKLSLKTLKILGAITLSLGSLSLFFVATKSNSYKEVKADVDYSAATSYHNSGNSYSLYTTLQNLTYTNKTWTYKELWTLYSDCFYKDSPGGKIKDYYSSATNYSAGTNQCGNYGGEGDCYNREHSIPKSWWGGAESKQGADPLIVFPTDGYVNSKRSNYPFGVVASASYTSQGGYSKLGSANSSYGYNGTVFEPADEVKGDFARLVFYACVRYSSSSSNYANYPTYNWVQADNGNSTFSGSAPTSSNFNGFCLTNYAIKLFTEWHNNDKPDQWERNLNDRIYAKQSNRNPFVDHPEYVNTLWGKISGANPTIYSDGTGVAISKTSVSLTSGGTTTINATSSNNSTITWTTSNSSVASLSSSSSSSGSNITITAGSTGSATITAKATIGGVQYSQTCAVTVTSAQPTISLSETSISLSVGATKTLVATTTNGSGSVTWSSSKENVATVNSSGVVEGVSAGSATITATYSGVSATCSVTVTDSGSIEGDSETLDFTAQNYTNGASVTSLSAISCVATLDVGTGNNPPKYYTTGEAVRCYPGNTITVSSTQKTIIKIELVFGSGDGSNQITSSPATYSNGIWTGNASSVTFTIGGSSGHRRIAKIIVTYEGEEEPSFSYETSVGYLMSFTNNNSTRYFIGTLSGANYGNTSASSNDAMTMYFEENGDNYNMYFINQSNVKNYLYVSDGKLALTTSQPSVKWNQDTNGLYCQVSSSRYYIGGNGSYTTFGVYTSSNIFFA